MVVTRTPGDADQGYKTRKNKATDKFIVVRRRRDEGLVDYGSFDQEGSVRCKH